MPISDDNDTLFRNPAFDTLLGAVAGGLFGVFLLLVGIGRALRASLFGRSVSLPGADDAWFAAVYVAVFVVGGGLLGLAAPLLRAHLAKVFAGALLGGLGMTVLAMAYDPGPLNGVDLGIALIVGGIFGALGGLVFGSIGRSPDNLAEMDKRLEEIESSVAVMRRARERARGQRANGMSLPKDRETDTPS